MEPLSLGVYTLVGIVLFCFMVGVLIGSYLTERYFSKALSEIVPPTFSLGLKIGKEGINSLTLPNVKVKPNDKN